MTSFSAKLFDEPVNEKLSSKSNAKVPFNIFAGETESIMLKTLGLKTYGPDDIEYKFNSYGTRSEEFENIDTLRILNVGCSFTEGVGLPLEHIWCSILIRLISETIGKELPLFNLSVHGGSADLLTRLTYNVVRQGFKPDLVIMLLPSLLRNELVITGQGYSKTFDFVQNSNPSTIEKFDEKIAFTKYLKQINRSQRLLETFKSLLFLKYFLESQGIRLLLTTWENTEFEKSDINGFESGMTSYYNELVNHSPVDLKANILPVEFKRNESKLSFKPHIQEIARDLIHPGPNSHFNFAKETFEYLINDDRFKELLLKWK